MTDEEDVALAQSGRRRGAGVFAQQVQELRAHQGAQLFPHRRGPRRHRAGRHDRPVQGHPRFQARKTDLVPRFCGTCASPARSSPPSKPPRARSTFPSTAMCRSTSPSTTRKATARCWTSSARTCPPTPRPCSSTARIYPSSKGASARCSPTLEKQVLALYMEGKSYVEISEAMGRHVKSVDNALQRIKRKLLKYLEKK